MIGIITLPNFMFYNYGGVLQNYALYRFLFESGYDVEAIHCNSNTLQGALRMLVYNTLHVRLLKNRGKVVFEYAEKTVRERNNRFERFISDNMRVNKYLYYSNKVYEQIDARYDRVIVGSDQVWNPHLVANNTMLDTYMLTFLPKEKRLSYAASFGVSEVPESLKIRYADALRNFHGISVRENSGAKIIKDLTGEDVEVHIDPTLLLSRSQWIQVAQKHPKRTDKPYILKYFLGNQSADTRNQISMVSKKYNLDIYELANREAPEFYESGPAEFIDLFQHASLIFTDSFHATVFSIIFGHPCVVMNRQQVGMDKMGSRIDTLFDKLGINKLSAESITESVLSSYNYEYAYEKLRYERTRAESYLNNVLAGERHDKNQR